MSKKPAEANRPPSAVGAGGQQHVLLHQGAQPQQLLVEAGAGERPVELDRVVADQQHQHRIGTAALDPAQHLAVVLGGQADEHLVADLGPAGPCIAPGGRGRAPGPDIVVADDAPPADAQLLGHPAQRREQLLGGGLADQEHPFGALAALVQRRVDVRHAAAHPGGNRLADRRDVPAGDGRDRPGRPQGVDPGGDPLGRGPAVDDHEPDLAPEHPAFPVDLLGRQLGACLTGGPEDPSRALQGDDEGDVQVVGVGLENRRSFSG